MRINESWLFKLIFLWQVEGSSLYLKEEFGNMSFWPNESGRFNSSSPLVRDFKFV